MLVIGGARSGKSRYAQAVAERCPGALFYLATAEALDGEMRDRIVRHQADRGPRWTTVEAPVALDLAIETIDAEDAVLLIDCLTLWVSNLLLAGEDIDAHLDRLDARLAACKGRLVFVTNEVGLGIVPDNALARRFRDAAGTVNQRVAARVARVHCMIAGLPLILK